MVDLDSKICPICGKYNKCMHNKDCWCMEKEIPAELIESVPIEKRNKACICEGCVDKFNNEREV